MSQEYGDDFITITDEDGTEYELEVLAELEYQDATYLALVPSGEADSEDLEVSILKVEEEDGEEILIAVENDQELEAVYGLLMEQLYEEEKAE